MNFYYYIKFLLPTYTLVFIFIYCIFLSFNWLSTDFYDFYSQIIVDLVFNKISSWCKKSNWDAYQTWYKKNQRQSKTKVLGCTLGCEKLPFPHWSIFFLCEWVFYEGSLLFNFLEIHPHKRNVIVPN